MMSNSIKIGLILIGALLFSAIGMLLSGNIRYSLICVLLAISISASVIISRLVIYSAKDELVTHPGQIFKILASLYFIVLSLELIMVYSNDGRSLVSVCLTGVLFSIIFIEYCFAGQKREVLILVQIITAQLANAYALVLPHSLFFGGTDIFFHIEYTKVIIQSGHVINSAVDPSYSFFPLYHILSSQISLITGLSAASSLFIVFPFISTFGTIIIYMITKQICGSQLNLPVLAALMWSLSFEVIGLISYPVPRMIAFIIVLFLSWMFLRYREKKGANSIAVMILFISALILVHSVTMIVFTLLIIILSLVYKVCAKRSFSSTTMQTLIVVMLMGYWFYVSFSFTSGVLDHILNPVNMDSQLGGATGDTDLMGTVVRFSPYLLTTGLFFIGMFRLINVNRFPIFVLVIFSLISLGVFLPNPIFADNYYGYNYNLYRLVIFSVPVVALMSAYGLNHVKSILIGSFRHRNNKVAVISLLSIVILSIFILNNLISGYSSDFNDNMPSMQFSEREIIGAEFTSSHINEPIVSDYSMVRQLLSFQVTQPTSNNNLTINVLYNENNTLSHNGQFLLLRTDELYERHQLVIGSTAGVYTWYLSDGDILSVSMSSVESGILYSNGDAIIVMPTTS